ncbi:MAG: bifunctional diguanylate cyclase/phosphodiesterase [Acholeplasma sp.]|nr:bifunctional diguanylate cyclase/phosphodiesterase [Acholeplasma sp.]
MMQLFASDVTNVILTILIVGVIVFLGYVLLKVIINEVVKEREEKSMAIDGVISKSEMNTLITTYMTRTGAPFSLLYIDLDKLNDFALAFGDGETKKMIKNVANRIKKELPAKTYLSRYQKDDFLVFIPSEYSKNDVLEIGSGILESFREKTIIFDDEEIDLTASIAVAQYPNHGSTVENLIQSLLLSIYSIKKEGGNAIKVYSQSLNENEENMNMYYQIKKAIENKEFTLFYQPIIDLKKKSLIAYEALLRWEHPELGIMAPNKFIAIMEQSGDIHWVGEWGFEKLVIKYLELVKNEINVDYLTINLSQKQLMNNDLPSKFEKILKKHKVQANRFVLEIGEFTIFEKQETIINNLLKLKDLKFNIAIDGFGIDISKFDKLNKFGIDIVKVDYKFIAEESFSVSKYMEFLTEYAKKEAKIVVCQGIENIEEQKRVLDFSIDKVQGYFYSKPLNSEEMLNFSVKNIDNYV